MAVELPHTKLLPFTELREGQPHHRRIYAARADEVRSQMTGKSMTVERLLLPDWVVVIAINKDDEVALVRQWRFGSKRMSVEFPAGVLECGEDPLQGGLRELREETGCTPISAARVVATLQPNPAFMVNHCHVVLVTEVHTTHEQELDDNEEVERLWLARSHVDEAVKSGLIDHAVAIAAWYLAKLHIDSVSFLQQL
jgi:ADP-ribose pyrophosphatase